MAHQLTLATLAERSLLPFLDLVNLLFAIADHLAQICVASEVKPSSIEVLTNGANTLLASTLTAECIMRCVRAWHVRHKSRKLRSANGLFNGEALRACHAVMRAPWAGMGHLQEDLAVQVEDHAVGVIQLVRFSLFLGPLA
jgi:hypothetical protein